MWKKPRSSNLSYVEEVLLVDLCLKYRDVIENKRTDAMWFNETVPVALD